MVKNVLVAVDGSSHANKAVEFAGEFASKFGARVRVLHVVQEARIPDEMKKYMESEHVGGTPSKAYLETVGKRIISDARKALAEHGVTDIETTLLVGDAPEEIIKFAKKNRVDLIILGNQGLGKVKEFLIGSVTSKVVRSAHCTCITVK
jgi:nucleotide-binding universal stress UspA family protein